MDNQQLNHAASTAHPLFFMHLPKTAGTSVFHILKGYLGDRVFSAGPLRVTHDLTGSELLDHVWNNSEDLFDGRLAYVFHGTPRFIERMPAGTKRMIMLREPVSRLVSAYKYRRRVKAARNMGEYGRNLENFATFVLKANDTDNIYLDRLSDGTGDLDTALARLGEFDVVGITERFAGSVELLCELQGWILPPTLPRARKSPDDVDVLGELDEEAKARLDEITAADRVIYHKAIELFEDQHQRMTRRLVDGQAVRRPTSAMVRDIDIRPETDVSWHGWHGATPNGRWSGPSSTSAIDVPLRIGNYLVDIDVGRAINSSVRSSLTVSFNDRLLPLVATEAGTLEARIHESDFKSAAPVSRLTFRVSETGRPADSGGSGPAKGILLRGVTFTAVGRSLTASGPTPMSTDKPPYVIRTPGFPEADQRTVVVVGSPRGGTSMVAGALRELGVFLGPRLGHNHEDPAFLSRDVAQIRKTIAERNATHDVWGWKVPHSIEYLDDVLSDLRAPHFVTVVRNPVAVAMSNHYHSNMPVDQSLQTAMGYYNRIVDFVARSDAPLMLIDYERALREQRPFVDGLVEFLGLQPSSDQVARATAFIDPSTGYRQVSSFDYELKPVAMPEGGEPAPAKVEFLNIDELGEGRYRATTSDPIVVISADGGLPQAFFMGFEFNAATDTERAKFYFDFEGDGFSENMSLTTELASGPHWFRVETGTPLQRLRYDPIDHDGEFGLSDLTIIADDRPLQ